MKKVIVFLLMVTVFITGCSLKSGNNGMAKIDTKGFTAKHIEITNMSVDWTDNIIKIKIKNTSNDELAIRVNLYVCNSDDEEVFISCKGISKEPVILASGEESDWLLYYGAPEENWETIIIYDYGHMEEDVFVLEDFFVAVEKDGDKTVSIADKKKVRKMWDELSTD